jgi:uncharacterized YigZ family protein
VSSYSIPAERLRFTLEVKRSRFITTLITIREPAQMSALLDQLKQEFPDASHHCWAYLIGPPKSSAQVGMSDDGEPKGTAGRPMLNVLMHAPMGDVAVVVTRYFGGTKLGTGGLMRAYSDCVKAALDRVKTTDFIDYLCVHTQTSYALLDHILRQVEQLGGQIIDSQYGEQVDLHLNIPTDQINGFKDYLTYLAC